MKMIMKKVHVVVRISNNIIKRWFSDRLFFVWKIM